MPGKWELGLLIYFEGQEDPDRISLFEGSYRECTEEHRSLAGIELAGDLPAAPELLCTYVHPLDEAGEQEAVEIGRKRISSVVN
jgi:hypothetical protein